LTGAGAAGLHRTFELAVDELGDPRGSILP